MKLKLLILLSVFAVKTPCMKAQSIITDFDKMIVLVDSLNLPGNTSLETLLSYLPELLQRPGDFVASNYDVQVDELSVGVASDAALSELHVADIEKIEISESPVSSYHNNGQGGSINFVLRTRKDDGTWGSVGLSTSNPLDFSPHMNIGYRKNKLMIRGIALAELYDNDKSSEKTTYVNDVFSSMQKTETAERFRTQMAKAYGQYRFTDRDILKLSLSELSVYDKMTDVTDYVGAVTKNKSSATMLQSKASFEHKYGRSSIVAEAEFYNQSTKTDYDRSGTAGYNTDSRKYGLTGKVEYTTFLLQSGSSNDKQKSLRLYLGSTFNRAIKSQTIAINDLSFTKGHDLRTTPEGKSFHLMPYVILEGMFGKLHVKGVAEYQTLKSHIEQTQIPYTNTCADFTGKLMTEWHFDAHNNLRFILDRKLERPDDEQIYPYLMFDVKQMSYVQGNSDLRPMMSHEVTLDYIADFKWTDKRSLVFNIAANYNHLSDIINPVEAKATDNNAGVGYRTFGNDGKCNIASTSLMAIYSYGTFSLAASGNLYHKMQGGTSHKDHCTYYNLSVHPHFKLKDGWQGGVKLTYHSKVDEADGQLGDCALAHITVGRSWKKFYVYVSQRVTIQKSVKNVSQSGNTRVEDLSELVPNMVRAGFKYTF